MRVLEAKEVNRSLAGLESCKNLGQAASLLFSTLGVDLPLRAILCRSELEALQRAVTVLDRLHDAMTDDSTLHADTSSGYLTELLELHAKHGWIDLE